jgi:RNA polymerase sigma-70 factor (ECF subfamily)
MTKEHSEVLSLENLYETYKNQIYTLCVRLARSQNHADDLFGDTWVKIAEKITYIKKEKNPMNYIYTVCLNIYRKSAPKWEKIEFFDDDNEPVIVETDLPAEAQIIETETMQQLQKALSALKDKYRIPILLFYFRDLSYNAISEIMKLPMSTVKFRLSHAKELLKKEMEVLL